MPENSSTAKQSWARQRGPLRWVKRHKKLVIVLAILIAIVAFIVSSCMRAAEAVSNVLAYQFVRTTTLQKTSLVNSVSVNGTVASGSTASVTASDSVKTCKVTSVNVAVGDTVRLGDVIATLDTTDVEKQIESAQQNYSDSLTDASTSYVQSVEDQSTNLAQLQQDLADAQEDYDTLGLTDYYSSMENTAGATGTNRELVEYYYGLFAEKIAGLQNTINSLNIQLTNAKKTATPTRCRPCRASWMCTTASSTPPWGSAPSPSWACRALIPSRSITARSSSCGRRWKTRSRNTTTP